MWGGNQAENVGCGPTGMMTTETRSGHPNNSDSTRRSSFTLIAALLICVGIFSAFRVGILRDLHTMIADAAWGRVQFAIGAAITALYHGGYGYTSADAVRAALAKGGLTGAPIELRRARVKFPDNLRNPSLIDNAISKAVEIKWDFNPNESVTGSAGEDLGLVDFVRLSFILFGNKVSSFFFTYFTLMAVSVLAAIIAFRRMPGLLAMFVLYSVALFTLFKSQ